MEMFCSINEVDIADWERVTTDDVMWSAAYHRALEQGCSSNVSFRYILIYDDKEPVAACYFQLVDLKNQTFKNIFNQNYFENIFQKLNGLGNDYVFGNSDQNKSVVCICGNLFVSGNYGISTVDADIIKSTKKTFTALTKLIEDSLVPETKLFATVLKDFDQQETARFSQFEDAGFVDFEIDPDMILHLKPEWKSYADYLEAFSSKYRVRANNAETKAETLVIRNFNVAEIIQHTNEIEQLFHEVLQNAPVRIACNTAAYFENLKIQLQERFVFKAFILDGKLVAFSTAVITNGCIHAHHIGLNYKLNKEYALYQNILYHYVRHGIALNKSHINFGRDAMEIKSTIGAVPLHLKLFVKFSGSITQLLSESFLKLSKPKPWIQRRPFKV